MNYCDNLKFGDLLTSAIAELRQLCDRFWNGLLMRMSVEGHVGEALCGFESHLQHEYSINKK